MQAAKRAEVSQTAEIEKEQLDFLKDSQERLKDSTECECAPDLRPLLENFKGELKSKKMLNRLRAAKTLKLLGKEAAPAISDLCEVLKEDSPVSEEAAKTLGTMGKRGVPAIPMLQEAMENTESQMGNLVNEAAAEALGAIGREVPRWVLPHLQKALKNSNPGIRKAAAMGFGPMGKEAAAAVPDLAPPRQYQTWQRP